MKIGLVFPVINNFKGLTEAVQSAKSVDHDLQTYIIPQWRHQVPLAKAWNAGAEMAFNDGCAFALVCNDDILFSPDTIDALVNEYQRLRHSDNVILVTPNNIRAELADPLQILNYQRPDVPFSWSEHPNFSCFLIAPEFFELHGTFDENFVPAWFEDNDSHRRANLLGYKEICTTAAPQVHFGGVSTSMMENPHSGESQKYYIEKWGGLPHPATETYSTPYNDPNLTPKDWRQNNG